MGVVRKHVVFSDVVEAGGRGRVRLPPAAASHHQTTQTIQVQVLNDCLLQLPQLNGGVRERPRATNINLAKIRDGRSSARVHLELLCMHAISVQIERYT